MARRNQGSRPNAARRASRRNGGIIQPRAEYAVDLADGRRLGVAEFGPRDGRAIFWFHGTPGARRQVPPNARAYAEQHDLRIIGVERPGVGLSTPHLYESFLGWTRDIAEVADELDIDRFGAIGLSGGGPYVLACAHEFRDRMVGGAVLGGVAPARGRDAAAGGIVGMVTPLSNTFAALRYPMGVAFSSFVRALHPFTDSVFPLVLRAFPEGDRRVLSRPDMREMFIDDLKLGSSVGLHSVISDVVLFTRPWGFLLRDIEVPIHFWQGDADPLVPFSHGAHQAALVRQSSLVHRPDEGHLGGLDQAEAAIESILQYWPGRRGRSATRRPA